MTRPSGTKRSALMMTAATLCAALLAGACTNTSPAGSPQPSAAAGSSAAGTGFAADASSATPVSTPSSTPFPLLGALPTTPLDDETAARLQAELDRMVASREPDIIAAHTRWHVVWGGRRRRTERPRGDHEG